METFWGRFWSDDGGNIAVIVAFMMLPVLVLAGGATDIARFEAYRVQLQDGVDRAVLAAASLNQTVEVESTVQNYLKSLPFIADVELDYDYSLSINARSVGVTAHYPMPTGFLHLIGMSVLDVKVSARAEESRGNLEISLMLDMSGSMLVGSPSKISLLRPAAKQFIDAILTPDSIPTTSVSIVPYAGSVNIGATAMGLLQTPRKHNYSSCVEFTGPDYGTGWVHFQSRTQVPHFTHYHSSQNDPVLGWSWCPEDLTPVTYLSNDPALLKARIDSMKLYDGTGTAIGTNWGMLLLDPAARPFVSSMAHAGQINGDFADRPAAFRDGETAKVIVLMTDGEISAQYRPKQYDYPREKEGSSTNSTPESRATALQRLYAVCNRAKNNDVIVFTIGFQLSGTAPQEMRNCATTPNHYYDVTGLDIAGAFQAVATAIQNVRLTQ